jgi:hypothetical protein
VRPAAIVSSTTAITTAPDVRTARILRVDIQGLVWILLLLLWLTASTTTWHRNVASTTARDVRLIANDTLEGTRASAHTVTSSAAALLLRLKRILRLTGEAWRCDASAKLCRNEWIGCNTGSRLGVQCRLLTWDWSRSLRRYGHVCAIGDGSRSDRLLWRLLAWCRGW